VKIGTEETNKFRAMVALLVLALLSVIYGVRSSSPDAAAASPPSTAATAAIAKKSGLQVRENTPDPTVRTDLLLASQTKYEGGKRNIFRMEELAPPPQQKPIVPVRPDQQQQQQPPTPPPPPPINLKFFGFSSKPGEPKKVFLSEGDDIFVAVEGEIINRRYKILQINNTSVMVEDMLTNYKQPIPLTAPPPTG
jgi:hypothetical protein